MRSVLIFRKAYGMWFHFINLLIYLVFITSLTAFVATYTFAESTGGGSGGHAAGKYTTGAWLGNTSQPPVESRGKYAPDVS